jgi:ferredoxin-type protein NapG
MDRRSFFKAGLGKVSRTAVKIADEHVNQRAIRWVRPPFAHDELDFLIACTRCDKCIEACPHDVIFKLPARLGLQVAGTPAMDLVNKACHLCEDWPCVQACEPEALQFPEHNDDGAGEKRRSLPVLAKAVINSQTCLPYTGPECGACADSCPVPGALLWKGPKPYIDNSRCIGCGLCRQACILEPKAIKINSVYLQPEDNP